MMTLPKNRVIHALSHVKYPGSGKSLDELGMLGNVKIEGSTVIIDLVFNKKKDPFTASLKKAVEGAVKYYVDPEAAIIVNEILKTAGQEQNKKESDGLAEVKNIIAIASGKGGVGKSTVAVNLAVALALQGYRVGLLDADIFGPSIPKMFKLEGTLPEVTSVNGHDIISPVEKYDIKLLSVGFFLKQSDATIWRGPMASSALRQFLHQASWGQLDFLLVDLPPGTSDIHLTLVQEVPVTGAVIVSTPQDVAIADAVKSISMFGNEKINVPVLGLVENMSWFSPAEFPDFKYFIFGKGGCRNLAEKMNIPLLGEIPLVQGICEDSDNGKPTALDQDSPSGKAFAELSKNTVNQILNRNIKLEHTKKVEIINEPGLKTHKN
jgi:ATP-binding protein involved in chromosome partitioning